MRVYFEESFERDLRKVKNKGLLKTTKEVIDEMKKAGDLREIKNLKKLRGYERFYRIKVGNYRIGVEMAKDKVIFVRLLHRKDVYKYFP